MTDCISQTKIKPSVCEDKAVPAVTLMWTKQTPELDLVEEMVSVRSRLPIGQSQHLQCLSWRLIYM